MADTNFLVGLSMMEIGEMPLPQCTSLLQKKPPRNIPEIVLRSQGSLRKLKIGGTGKKTNKCRAVTKRSMLEHLGPVIIIFSQMSPSSAQLMMKQRDLSEMMVNRHWQEMRALTVRHLREIRAMNESMHLEFSSLDVDDTPIPGQKAVGLYLAFWKYIDGGRTYFFTQTGRVPVAEFRARMAEWVGTNLDVTWIDWSAAPEQMSNFDLKLEQNYVVGLSK